MLSLQAVSKKYGDTVVLDQVSVSIKAGEIVGLVGANGAGKTTLIKAILGLHEIDSGEMTFQGISSYHQQSDVMNEIGYLLDIELFDYLTAREHIQLLGMYEGVVYDDSAIREALAKVALKDDKKKIKAYSYGMKQRLRLALDLLRPRKLLILDEPLLGLDITAIGEFKSYLKEIAQSGVAVLLSSHQLSEIEDLINRYVVLEKGNISMEVEGKQSAYKLTLEGSTEQLQVFRKVLSQQEYADRVEQDGATLFVGDKMVMNAVLKEVYRQNLEVAIEQVNIVNKLFLEKGAKG